MDLEPFIPFQHWVHQLWVQNCEERLIYGGPRLDTKDYFNQFKWFLKREYRFQKEKHDNQQRRRTI